MGGCGRGGRRRWRGRLTSEGWGGGGEEGGGEWVGEWWVGSFLLCSVLVSLFIGKTSGKRRSSSLFTSQAGPLFRKDIIGHVLFHRSSRLFS